jgi:3',5'-cyclic AMP phosphodiesterase CpdA
MKVCFNCKGGTKKMKKRLITIVHVSDLHFGDLDPTSGNSNLSARAPLWWRYLKWFDGYLGHHAIALIHFWDIFINHLKKKRDVILVVTGDLTANGAASQFDLARRYLEGTLYISKQNPVGLNQHDVWSKRTVPGNHDHWPGSNLILGKPAALYLKFPGPPPLPAPLPISVNPISLRNGFTLLLAGIDTSSDVLPYGKDRFYARGKFLDHLMMLESELQSRRAKPKEIRVLLLHHSPQMSGKALKITDQSKKALDFLIKQSRINVLLTGHAHRPIGEIRGFTEGGQSWHVLEARCGTTLQRDVVPLNWVATRLKSATGKKFIANTFLVHKLYEENNRITWKTTEYRRMNRGFTKRGPLQDEGGHNIGPVEVWK